MKATRIGNQILVVDPATGSNDPIVRLLAANDYQVEMAASVEAAWRSLVSDRPDLLLLETMIPHGTEGFHMVWEVRKHPDLQLSRTPIVIVSGIHQTTSLNLFPDLEDGHYCAHDYLPVQGFLDKPVDGDKLLSTLIGLLPVRGASQRAEAS